MKKCSTCSESKPLSEFYKHRRDGYTNDCKKCCKQRSSNWYQKNKDVARKNTRASHLRRTYGITIEQYEELLAKQFFCCAVCARHQDEFDRNFAVDHNHKTREIRGLLCNNCNHRLIGRHTDGQLLRAMADYVEQGTGWFVPKKTRTKKRKPVRK